jgi:hypothetical protein
MANGPRTSRPPRTSYVSFITHSGGRSDTHQRGNEDRRGRFGARRFSGETIRLIQEISACRCAKRTLTRRESNDNQAAPRLRRQIDDEQVRRIAVEKPRSRLRRSNGTGVLRANVEGDVRAHPTTVRGAACSRLSGNKVNSKGAADLIHGGVCRAKEVGPVLGRGEHGLSV